jgi:multidrug resistance efflux pump
VKHVFVCEGQRVKARQLLAELDSTECQLRVIAAETQLRIAQAERERLALAVRDSSAAPENGRTSHFSDESRGRDTSANFSNNHEDCKIASARVELAQTLLRQEQLMLDKNRLVAPVDGEILTVPFQPGEVVGPIQPSDALLLANRDKIHVRAFVEELDALEVAVGETAVVMSAGTHNRQLHGTVISCSPYVAPKFHRHSNPGERLDVRVREAIVEVREADFLLIGLPVEVFINVP